LTASKEKDQEEERGSDSELHDDNDEGMMRK
jgi:hypothetical protein